VFLPPALAYLRSSGTDEESHEHVFGLSLPAGDPTKKKKKIKKKKKKKKESRKMKKKKKKTKKKARRRPAARTLADPRSGSRRRAFEMHLGVRRHRARMADGGPAPRRRWSVAGDGDPLGRAGDRSSFKLPLRNPVGSSRSAVLTYPSVVRAAAAAGLGRGRGIRTAGDLSKALGLSTRTRAFRA
jgi:hypothetical protein